MRTALLALLLTAVSVSAQNIPLITDIYPSPDGSRMLELRGLFEDADTVLVQVYHDSEVVTEEVRIYTWALPLGTFDWYAIKFTATSHRVKYLFLLELGDGVIEYVPEITIDFSMEGDLLLYKPQSGKPDFVLLPLGLGRKSR